MTSPDALLVAWLDAVDWDPRRIASALLSIDEAPAIYRRLDEVYACATSALGLDPTV